MQSNPLDGRAAANSGVPDERAGKVGANAPGASGARPQKSLADPRGSQGADQGSRRVGKDAKATEAKAKGAKAKGAKAKGGPKGPGTAADRAIGKDTRKGAGKVAGKVAGKGAGKAPAKPSGKALGKPSGKAPGKAPAKPSGKVRHPTEGAGDAAAKAGVGALRQGPAGSAPAPKPSADQPAADGGQSPSGLRAPRAGTAGLPPEVSPPSWVGTAGSAPAPAGAAALGGPVPALARLSTQALGAASDAPPTPPAADQAAPAAPEAPVRGAAPSGTEPQSVASQATPWPRHRGRLPARPPTPEQVEAKAASDAAIEAREAEGDEPDPELAKRPLPSEDELLEALTWAFQGEEVPGGLLPAFARHGRLVLEANRQLNLTAIVDAREVAVKHYLDSWRATRLLPMLGKHVVDLGSGAGFPGMPAALGEPNCRVTLVETRKKKADFLEQSIRQLGLKNARAVWARGEDFLATQRCDVVFIRALSSVRENVRMLRKVRHSFMDLILFKGPSWSREVRASEREAERLGFRLDTVWEHELPGGMGQRALLVYRSPSAH